MIIFINFSNTNWLGNRIKNWSEWLINTTTQSHNETLTQLHNDNDTITQMTQWHNIEVIDHVIKMTSRCPTQFEGIKLVRLHLCSLEYADDQILFTLTSADMQGMLDFLISSATPFGLGLSPDKCKLICFHRPGNVNKTLPSIVTFGDKVLKWKTSVIYLGNCFSEHGVTLVAVKHRISCAKTVVKCLNERVFQHRGVDSLLKGHFIDIAVFSSLLSGLVHCTVRVQDRRCIDGSFLRLAKRVLHLYYLIWLPSVVRGDWN